MKRTLQITLMLSALIVAMEVHAQDWGRIIGSAVTGVTKLAYASKQVSAAEEYYLGRSVAAMAVNQSSVINDPALTNYLNNIGQLLAATAEKPTYGGYHFAVLNDDVPNAFACPGGYIFVNKGLLKMAKNEDQVAAVVAHEVAHVSNQHGIKAIKKAQFTDLGFFAAMEVGSQVTPGEWQGVVANFGGLVTDVAQVALQNGYSRGDEKAADADGLRYMAKAGYNPQEMIEFFKIMEESGIGTKSGPFSSHPKTATRIKELEKDLSDVGGPATTDPIRVSRHKTATARLN